MTNARHRLARSHALHLKSAARQSGSAHSRPTCCGPRAVAHVQGADSLVPARGCRFPRVQAHGTQGPQHVRPQHVGGVRGSPSRPALRHATPSRPGPQYAREPQTFCSNCRQLSSSIGMC
jgi:hypothetical protein